ncbi:DNA-binding transcriptional regulator, PucR family [Halobacillus alkaliphilus]|uniref:DNA-binding transcriptional regulator, PucR family n=1 Tax=Halobacillus alkaliphilus TaxID=396056 RepID=A0A1I2KIF8_9BACI|nr:helix-turn-helix domain-containing protein [Halobacillus alkaliphilus]SFF64881.1 DNA-binding transcriptional regulator, PucR family [Halobacillus alkaliphilus]
MKPSPYLTYSYKDFIDSPEGLADSIAEVLGCPVTIEDANHCIVSYSKHEENVDHARTATIMRRKVPEHVINGLWKHGFMAKLFESDEPLVVHKIDDIGLGDRLAISVRKDNEILGFIWAQTNDSAVTSEHLEEMKEAAQWVSHYLLRQQAKKKKTDESSKEFFWQLLTGSLTNPSEIKRMAKKYKMNLNGQLCVAVFEFTEDMSQAVERHAYYLTETLHQTRVVNRIFDDRQLILLVRTDNKEDANEMNQTFIREFIQKMKERIHFEDLKGAFGLIYESPSFISDSYKQALKVLKLKEQYPTGLNHADNYQDLGVYQFINELAALQKKENYKNDALNRIKTYDERQNSMLLETLKVFLEHNSNVHQAAAHMHIHTNTLNYRLKRIKEIGNIDFKDVNQKTMLYLDLLIYENEQEDL